MDDTRPPVALQRAQGEVRASFRVAAGRTRIERLHQAGSLKLRFPRLPGGSAEAVLVNTAGGLAGGDRMVQGFDVADGAALTVTTQACERVYRSLGGEAEVATRILVGAEASISYLPQETILFDRGRLRRTLDVDAAATSRVLLCESVILGREAMGESVAEGFLADRWRIRRDGRLVFADDLRLGGPIAALAGAAAALGGARAFTTILALRADGEAVLPRLRQIIGTAGGASAFESLLVARLRAPSGFALRQVLVPALRLLAENGLPRVWSL